MMSIVITRSLQLIHLIACIHFEDKNSGHLEVADGYYGLKSEQEDYCKHKLVAVTSDIGPLSLPGVCPIVQRYDISIKIELVILRGLDVGPGGRCGIYGINSPKWINGTEVCNSPKVYYVPLYDTLGIDTIEFIIFHIEVPPYFSLERKIPIVLKCLPSSTDYFKFLSITGGRKGSS
jgi:hypothetical protein